VSDDLIEFLRARIADEEAVAKAAQKRVARWTDATPPWVSAALLAEQVKSPLDALAAMANPERVLADCQAKRSIVELCASPFDAVANQLESLGQEWEHLTDDRLTLTRAEYVRNRRLLAILALPHADHEDFQPEWRV
jgi:hypothetical protein